MWRKQLWVHLSPLLFFSTINYVGMREKKWVIINLSWNISESRNLPSMFDESTLEDSCLGNKSCNLLLVNLAGGLGRGVGVEIPWVRGELSPFQPHIRVLSDSKTCALQATENWAQLFMTFPFLILGKHRHNVLHCSWGKWWQTRKEGNFKLLHWYFTLPRLWINCQPSTFF